MAVTASQLATHFSKRLERPIKWGTNCLSKSSGVYIVCTPTTPWQFDLNVINYWCDNADDSTFKVGSTLTSLDLQAELQKYLIPDEEIVYIGKAKCLRKRLYAYYGTPLGKRRPHAGGYWIQTLQNLNDLDVYWIEDIHPAILEHDMLDYFPRMLAATSSCAFHMPIWKLQKDSARITKSADQRTAHSKGFLRQSKGARRKA